jgi:hypothetical protein
VPDFNLHWECDMQQFNEPDKEMSSNSLNMPADINLDGNNSAGLRERLKKIFHFLPTIKERRRFLWIAGKNPDDSYYSSPERYLAYVAMIATYKVGRLVGGALLLYFYYLSYRGFDAYAYTSVIYSASKPLQSTGAIGLYAYYFAKIMGPAVLTIVFLCFALFLIHVKRGGAYPLSGSPILRNAQDRTFKNLRYIFFCALLGGAICLPAAFLWNYAYLSLLHSYLFMQTPGSAGVVIWGAIVFILGLLAQSACAVGVYATFVSIWCIVFRYDKYCY